jgi:hypothetical protein
MNGRTNKALLTDALQPALVPRSGFRARVSLVVRLTSAKPMSFFQFRTRSWMLVLHI